MILPLAKPKKLTDDTPDPRDKRHRHGDAMSEVIFRAAGHGKDDRAVKTDLIVTLDLTMLIDGVAGATLDGGAVLPPSAVRRLACDAGLIPVVCNGWSRTGCGQPWWRGIDVAPSPAATNPRG